MSSEVLTLRQQIAEAVVGTGLELFGVVADLDNERARIREVRDYLEAQSTRSFTVNHIANVVVRPDWRGSAARIGPQRCSLVCE